jgi:hypothetical protein
MSIPAAAFSNAFKVEASSCFFCMSAIVLVHWAIWRGDVEVFQSPLKRLCWTLIRLVEWSGEERRRSAAETPWHVAIRRANRRKRRLPRSRFYRDLIRLRASDFSASTTNVTRARMECHSRRLIGLRKFASSPASISCLSRLSYKMI